MRQFVCWRQTLIAGLHVTSHAAMLVVKDKSISVLYFHVNSVRKILLFWPPTCRLATWLQTKNTCHITRKPNSSFHKSGRSISKISRGWLQAVFLTAFSPCLLPHRFLFRPRLRIRAPYFANHKRTPKNRQLWRLPQTMFQHAVFSESKIGPPSKKIPGSAPALLVN